jgi:hypothetical protein
MHRLPSFALASALAAAVLVSGCGSSSTSSGGSTSSPAASSSTGSTSTTGSTSKSTGLAELIMTGCRAQLAAQPALTSAARAQIESACSRAAQGGATPQEVTRKVCIEIVKRSALQGSPMTPAREKALAACKTIK